MPKTLTRSVFFSFAFAACSILALNIGCASGGFKLTRDYARFVNSKNIILRIILYIFTSIVFAVTMLIDMVIFNTIDFWQGKVSAGDYQYKSGDKTYFVHHEYSPEGRRRSKIKVLNGEGRVMQEVVLAETESQEIEMYVDGRLRTRVSNVTSLPVAEIYDQRGDVVTQALLIPEGEITVTAAAN